MFLGNSLSFKSQTILDEAFIRKTAFIEVSHLINMATAVETPGFKNVYLPGLRLSLISSKLDNMKIVSLKKALSASYSKNNLVASISKLDFRLLGNGARKVSNGLRRDAERIRLFIDEGYSKYSEPIGVHSKYTLIAQLPLCKGFIF